MPKLIHIILNLIFKYCKANDSNYSCKWDNKNEILALKSLVCPKFLKFF